MLRVKEHAPTLFFFRYFTLGPTFGSFEEFGGMSELTPKVDVVNDLWGLK
jgi:hypothetical protein